MSGYIAYNVSNAHNNQYDGINQTGHNEQRCPKNDKREVTHVGKGRERKTEQKTHINI